MAALMVCDPAGQPPVRVRAAAGERLVSVREGVHGTTAVIDDARDRWITVNNAYVLGGTALLHPVDGIVALEIVPEVALAARQDFADVNARVVDDPRVSVVIDDGRNYVASSARAFDVIVGDLLVPWRPAEAPLYTQEHFESVRGALTAEGVFCQWLPLYQLSSEQLAIIVRTLVEVFPRASLWRGNFLRDEATLALVGHKGPRPLDLEVDR